MKFFLGWMMAFLPSIFSPIVNLVKLELLSVYVRGVEGIRTTFILALWALVGVLLACASFVLIHVAAFILIPWDQQTGAFVMLGLGVLYLLIAAIIVIRICSRRAWMKLSGAEAMARNIPID